jgi:spermidine/putrescine transport system ATP-binding protein
VTPLPSSQTHTAIVESLLFDGANSAVLVIEERSRHELRIALPQTGAFADLRPGERIHFTFSAERAQCFAANHD